MDFTPDSNESTILSKSGAKVCWNASIPSYHIASSIRWRSKEFCFPIRAQDAKKNFYHWEHYLACEPAMHLSGIYLKIEHSQRYLRRNHMKASSHIRRALVRPSDKSQWKCPGSADKVLEALLVHDADNTDPLSHKLLGITSEDRILQYFVCHRNQISNRVNRCATGDGAK